MDQIASLLHYDVAKYKDIFNILHKLEEDGVVKEISGLFYKIFKSESKFALGELMKIQKGRPEKINVSKQYENNLSLFKSNFYLIVQLLLENTFKVVVKENQNKLVTKEKSTTSEDVETTNQTLEDTQSPRQKEKPFVSTTKKIDSPLRGSKKHSSEQKKSYKEKNSSPTTVLQGIVDKDIGRQSRSSKDFERENSLTHSPHLSTSSARKRSSNANSGVVSPLMIPVTSEFNKVQGSATFPTSERKFLDINLNGPGPAFYDVARASPSHLKRSVSPTIGNAKKQTWVDIATKTPSPGPGGLYPTYHFVSK